MINDKEKNKVRIKENKFSKLFSLIISYSLFSLILLFPLITYSNIIYAIPSGANIIYNSTGSAGIASPGSLTNERGTITTLVLYGVQQDGHWKAYVGNVTGVLTLDDSDGYTIYDWDLNGVTIKGEVYASRNSTLDFSSVSCADNTLIQNEESFYNMSSTESDSITSTFNYTLHDSFYVAGNQITADSCPSTATYINSTRQNMSSSANIDFQEVLLKDNNNNLLFVSLIEDDVNGYRVDGSTYDFQMLVPESDVKVTPTTFYFYLEIES